MAWVYLDQLLEAVASSIVAPQSFDNLLPVEPERHVAPTFPVSFKPPLGKDALLAAQLRSVKNSFRRSRAASIIENALHNEDLTWFEATNRGLLRRNPLLKAEVMPLLARCSAEFDVQFKICTEHDLTLESAGFFRHALSGLEASRLMQVALEKAAIDDIMPKYIAAAGLQFTAQSLGAPAEKEPALESSRVAPLLATVDHADAGLDRHAHSSRITDVNAISSYLRAVTYEVEASATATYALGSDGKQLFRAVWSELVRRAEKRDSGSVLQGGELFKPPRAKEASYHLIWRDPDRPGGKRLTSKEQIRKRVLPDSAR